MAPNVGATKVGAGTGPDGPLRRLSLGASVRIISSCTLKGKRTAVVQLQPFLLSALKPSSIVDLSLAVMDGAALASTVMK